MENPERRKFIIAGGAGLAGLTLAGMNLSFPSQGHSSAKEQSETVKSEEAGYKPLKPVNLAGKALVVWYSQTSNTARTGRCIAKSLERTGLTVNFSDYRELKPSELSGYDLIIAGSPVYYYDVPSNFKTWLAACPTLKGKHVAAFVTFGGEGGNQHNTACTLLDLLTSKGGIPAGLETFGNMSTFAVTWSTGNKNRIMKYSHLPDGRSYSRMRDFALAVAENMKHHRTADFKKTWDYREWIKGSPSIKGTKALINRHSIDKDLCVECGLCVRNCPVSAIDLAKGTIDGKACIACLGCVNNCPEQAMDMEFMFMGVKGFTVFRKENGITITEPEAWFAGQKNT
jgi:ferredoxin